MKFNLFSLCEYTRRSKRIERTKEQLDNFCTEGMKSKYYSSSYRVVTLKAVLLFFPRV